MTPEEIAALASQVAAILAGPGVPIEATSCGCDGSHSGTVVAAPAVAVSDAPASLAPEDGMDPISQFEAIILELRSRMGALDAKVAALESDISTMLVERTDAIYVG